MVSSSRFPPSIQSSATVSDAAASDDRPAAVPTTSLPTRSPSAVPSASAPVLPKSMSLNGKQYPVGALKGRKTSEQKAYLAAALNAAETASISVHADNRFTYGATVAVNPDVGPETLSIELKLDAAGQMSSVTLANNKSQNASFCAEFDGAVPHSVAAASFRLNEAQPSIPAGAVLDGAPLPWHPDGERYQAMPYKQSGVQASLMLTGLPHANGQKFDVYDVKTHTLILQLPIVKERSSAGGNVLVSHRDARLPGGMRHLKRMAQGVKTSSSSPTGYKLNGEPCDRHGNFVSSSSSVQGPTSAVPQPLRSALQKTVVNGMKQYRLNNRPIGESYAVKNPEAEQNDPVVISQKYASVIYQRRNPASPYLRKVKTDIHAAPETQHKIDVHNKIARLVAGNRRAKHFVVEIFSGEKNGEPRYIARRVNGFSLDNSTALEASRKAGELTDTAMSALLNDLGEAVDWLNRSGYFHNDIQLANIMYDRDSKALALIDFELSDQRELYGRAQERPQIDAIKNNIL